MKVAGIDSAYKYNLYGDVTKSEHQLDNLDRSATNSWIAHVWVGDMKELLVATCNPFEQKVGELEDHESSLKEASTKHSQHQHVGITTQCMS